MSSSPDKANPPCTCNSAATKQIHAKRKCNMDKESAIKKTSKKAKPTTQIVWENRVAAKVHDPQPSKKAKPVPKKKKEVVLAKETAATTPVVDDADVAPAAIVAVPENKKTTKKMKRVEKKISARAEDIAPAAVKREVEDANAIVVVKKKTVPRVKKAPLTAADKPIDDDDSKFASTSRPQTLAELAKELSNEQKEALEKIGFDSLMKIKIDKLPTQMLGWLVKQFNGTSRMLRINPDKAFVITPADIRDVLMLPMNNGQRVEVFKKNDDITAVKEFKTRCGIGESISVAKLKMLLLSEPYKKGGEDFKRLYVLVSLSSFLAPTANTAVDFAPLKALLDVDAISKLDWCSFVLDRLCKVVNKYNRGLVTKVSGCVLALQIIYLHRMKWKGRAEPNALPLIQHWTTETMRERIKEESVAGEYGQGEWVEHTYPVSRNEPAKVDMDLLLDAIAQEDTCEEEVSTPMSGDVYIRFKLPPGVPTDAEIKKESIDHVQEMFLLLRRDMCIVSEHYMERLKKMKDKVPPPPPPRVICKNLPVSSMLLNEKFSIIEEYLHENEKLYDKLWDDENVYRVLTSPLPTTIS